jgi:hypothetical protein
VDGGISVQQFADGAVDVVDAAAQQNRLQAASGVPGSACGKGIGGQRVVLLSSCPCGRWTSGGDLPPGS